MNVRGKRRGTAWITKKEEKVENKAKKMSREVHGRQKN